MVRVWIAGMVLAFAVVGCGGPAEDTEAPTLESTEPLTAKLAVTGFTPAKAVQGATVTITGSAFTASASVAFNGVASQDVAFVSASRLRATVPEGATSGPIKVTTATGSASSSTAFLVLLKVDSLSSTAGVPGDTVQVVGSGFTGVTSVTLGSIPSSFTFQDDEHLAAVIPASAVTGRFSVTTPAGTASSTSFTIEKAPKITSFTPASSELPATLTIVGNNFIGTTQVLVGAVALPTFTVVSAKEIDATVPLGTPSGKITVVDEAGSATSKTAFVAVPCADADADTVCDSADVCHGFDDRQDADHDGVPDGCDVCPADNPNDSDGDTICNSVDRCPGSDDRVDADGDGIPDGCDPCPGPQSAGQSCGLGRACSALGVCAPLRCDASTTGAGVVHGDVIVDDINTTEDLQPLAGAWCVTGNVFVTGTILRDLTALQTLAEVGGSLNIGVTLPNCTFPCTSGNQWLTSLHGLESLRRVGGDLHVYEWYSPTTGITSLGPLSSLAEVDGNLVVDSTNVLTDLHGLENVHSVNYLQIVFNRALKTLAGIEGVHSASMVDIYDDEQLTDVTALRNLSTVPGMYRIYRTAITSLAGLEGLRSVSGDFILNENPELADLASISGLTTVSGGLFIGGSPVVSSLAPLAHLTRVNTLDLYGLGVTSLHGLENLTAVGSLSVSDCPYLGDLSALSHVTEPVSFVSVNRNASLQTLADLNGFTGVMMLDIEGNASLLTCSNVTVNDGGNAVIDQNPVLTSLSCLSNTHRLESLRIDDDDSLATLDDLSSMSYLFDLRLTGNDALRSLQGLHGLTTPSPTGIDLESNSQLTDLRGLEGMTQLSQLYVAQNSALTSLAGLEGLASVQGWLGFSSNASLPECSLAALAAQLGRPVDYDSGNTGTGDCGQ